MAAVKSTDAGTQIRKRNPAATKERILKAGLAEFGSKGYGGARTNVVAQRAKCNIRMIYHYFGGKQELYLACLDRVYSHIRQEEQKLDLLSQDPVQAISTLVQFTFDHMRNNPDFVHIAGVENTQRAQFLKKLTPVATAAHHLIETIDKILERGMETGDFRKDIDAFQLYISILSLSYLHLANRFTLSVTYSRDISDNDWLNERRQHVRDVILSYVIK